MRLHDLFSVNQPQPVTEGGHVFAGRTAAIAREHIQPTLEKYFSELQQVFPQKRDIFNLEHFVPLGSVGKKALSGDIDLGISSSDIMDKTMSAQSISQWGIDPEAVDAQQEKLAKRARTATPEQLRIKAFLQLLAQKINSAAPNIHVEEKKVTPGNMFSLFPQYDAEGNKLDQGVQIDWMVGNLEWLTFSYYSDAYPEGSNVKGLHRTQLMLSAFQVAGLSFDHVKGVTDKETGEVVATDPAGALQILNQRLGTDIDRDTTANYYALHGALKQSLTPAQYDLLIAIYFKILDSTRADIPDDLQQTWRDRQAELGLRGKFLPDSSQLAPLRVAENEHTPPKHNPVAKHAGKFNRAATHRDRKKDHKAGRRKHGNHLEESGVAGAPRVPSRAQFAQFLADYEQLISQFPGFQSMKPTGSYHSDPDKEDFGDIDLVVHIQSDEDKAQVKRELVAFMQAQPETVIVPFSSSRHAGKRTYNAGELVTVRFHSDTVGDSAQIDNIIALSPSEATYKQEFLDYAAPKQGLILGLVKVAAQETDPTALFRMLDIDIDPELPEDQEWEFNISPVELQLRRVSYEQGTTQQASRDIVWRSRDMQDLERLLYQYDLDADFESLLAQAQQSVRNPRSGPRIVGLFRSMITVKSGEVGTPKAQQKIQAIKQITQAFGG